MVVRMLLISGLRDGAYGLGIMHMIPWDWHIEGYNGEAKYQLIDKVCIYFSDEMLGDWLCNILPR